MFKRTNFIAFSPFIFGVIIYSLIAWKNATTANTSPISSQNPVPSISVQSDKKIPIYFIGFDIQFATGIPEADIETYVKNPKKYYKPCAVNFSDFKRTLDNDLTGLYSPVKYEPHNVRAKFILDNTAYYIDYSGLLSQPIDGFKHVNKQQISQLVQANCKH